MKNKHPSKLSSDDAPDSDLVGRTIQQWRNTWPDVDLSGKAVIGRLVHLANSAHQSLDAALAACDLNYYEYSALATLRASGSPWELSPSKLKATLSFTSGGLSNLLKRLEKRQFITRSENPHDGRGVLVRLTQQGKQLVDAAIPHVCTTKASLVRMLNARERAALARLLCRMGLGLGSEGW